MSLDRTRPTAIERYLEGRFPEYRFGVVMILLFITYVFMASSPPDTWVRVITVALQGLTLLAALLASRAHRRIFRVATVVVAAALLASLVSLIAGSSHEPTGFFFALNVLLVGATPIAIGRALWRQDGVDIHTVFGAICIYVLLGMTFAFFYAALGTFQSQPFFAQTDHGTLPDFLYFAFVTQTTVGFGDLTARGDLGRAVTGLQALVGQLYLVTVVAVLVSRMTVTRRRDPASDGSPGDDAPGTATAADAPPV
ncbi:MAG: Ion channel [Actinomycetia bacterium]|nr:Ion channel [Actinomycetes bacterium]